VRSSSPELLYRSAVFRPTPSLWRRVDDVRSVDPVWSWRSLPRADARVWRRERIDHGPAWQRGVLLERRRRRPSRGAWRDSRGCWWPGQGGRRHARQRRVRPRAGRNSRQRCARPRAGRLDDGDLVGRARGGGPGRRSVRVSRADLGLPLRGWQRGRELGATELEVRREGRRYGDAQRWRDQAPRREPGERGRDLAAWRRDRRRRLGGERLRRRLHHPDGEAAGPRAAILGPRGECEEEQRDRDEEQRDGDDHWEPTADALEPGR